MFSLFFISDFVSVNVLLFPSISYLKINNDNAHAFLDCSNNITSTNTKLVNNKKGIFRKKIAKCWNKIELFKNIRIAAY